MVSNMQASWAQLSSEGKDAYTRGDFTAGRELFTRSLAAAHDEGAGDNDIAEVFLAFGSCLVAAGDRAEGRQRLTQALQAFERGADSPKAQLVQRLLAPLKDLPETEPASNGNGSYAPAPMPATVATPEVQKTPWGEAPPIVPSQQAAPAASVPAHAAIAPTAPPAPTLPASTLPAPTLPAPTLPAPIPAAPASPAPAAFAQATPAPAPAPQPSQETAQSISQAKRKIKVAPREADPTYDQIMADRASAPVTNIMVDEFIHPREKLYGILTLVMSVWLYFILTITLVALAIVPLAMLAAFISSGIHLGHLRSRGIKVTPRQFPEVYDLVDKYSTAMNMQPPEVYVVQEHGLLNAFANRLHRKDIIVIYSDVMELAYEMGEKEMAFVVCHELAHIKRGHIKFAWLHIPGEIVPFLGTAYSRACEYTCDRIAAEIVPDGALFGLVCLAAGTKLYRYVNLKALYEQAEEEWGFWTWFAEIQSTHPNLMNRIRSIGLRDQAIRGFKAAATRVN